MATSKKTTKKAGKKARAKKTATKRARGKTASSGEVSRMLGKAAAKFLATGGDAEATETVVSSAAAQAKKRQRVERDLRVGTVLRRHFKGREIEVEVTDAGFEYQDQTFKSISAVARRITGYQISGPVFFKLDAEPEAE
jgi:hypothetical protein